MHIEKCMKLKLTDKSIMGQENIHVFIHCTCILACQYNTINTIQYNTIQYDTIQYNAIFTSETKH